MVVPRDVNTRISIGRYDATVGRHTLVWDGIKIESYYSSANFYYVTPTMSGNLYDVNGTHVATISANQTHTIRGEGGTAQGSGYYYFVAD